MLYNIFYINTDVVKKNHLWFKIIFHFASLLYIHNFGDSNHLDYICLHCLKLLSVAISIPSQLWTGLDKKDAVSRLFPTADQCSGGMKFINWKK